MSHDFCLCDDVEMTGLVTFCFLIGMPNGRGCRYINIIIMITTTTTMLLFHDGNLMKQTYTIRTIQHTNRHLDMQQIMT